MQIRERRKKIQDLNIYTLIVHKKSSKNVGAGTLESQEDTSTENRNALGNAGSKRLEKEPSP